MSNFMVRGPGSDHNGAPRRYEVPNPLQTDAESNRYYHFDLAGMSDLDLFREETRVKSALAECNPRDLEWFVERLAFIRRATAARSRNRDGHARPSNRRDDGR